MWKGGDRIELHLTPLGLSVQPKIDRAELMVDGAALPVREWLVDFGRHMPKVIADRLAAAVAHSPDAPTRVVLERFQEWFPLRVHSTVSGGRLRGQLLARRAVTGRTHPSHGSSEPGGSVSPRRRHRHVHPNTGGTPAGAERTGRLADGGDRLSAADTGIVEPDVCWVDDAADVPGLPGWAAVYQPDTHVLCINRHDIALDMVVRAVNASLGDAVGLEPRVRAAAEEAVAARLVAVLIGSQLTGHQLELTPQVLTGAVLDLVDNIDKTEPARTTANPPPSKRWGVRAVRGSPPAQPLPGGQRPRLSSMARRFSGLRGGFPSGCPAAAICARRRATWVGSGRPKPIGRGTRWSGVGAVAGTGLRGMRVSLCPAACAAPSPMR